MLLLRVQSSFVPSSSLSAQHFVCLMRDYLEINHHSSVLLNQLSLYSRKNGFSSQMCCSLELPSLLHCTVRHSSNKINFRFSTSNVAWKSEEGKDESGEKADQPPKHQGWISKLLVCLVPNISFFFFFCETN